MSDLPALQRLATVDQVAAAFVLNEDGKILGREVPAQYSDAALQQIAERFSQISDVVTGAEIPLKELRFTFENFSVWTRFFGNNHRLIIFLASGADPNIMRQPINLAVLNLEKGVKSVEAEHAEALSKTDLAEAALRAEHSIYHATGEDTNGFFSQVSMITIYFHGPVGPEILEQACRDHDLTLPISTGENMRKVVQTAASHLPNPDKKAGFENMAEDLVQRIELSAVKR
jgi:hypothetical protein